MSKMLYGSICLSKIPKELIKDVECKDGVKRKFLNLAIIENRRGSDFGSTHYVTCKPKDEEVVEGTNYIIGYFKTYNIDNKDNGGKKQKAKSENKSNKEQSSDSEELPF